MTKKPITLNKPRSRRRKAKRTKDGSQKNGAIEECKEHAKMLNSAALQAEVPEKEVKPKLDEAWDLIRRGADIARISFALKKVAELIAKFLDSS